MPQAPSTKTFSTAKSEVAGSSGSEGVTAMETMAGRAIIGAVQRWSSFWNWRYLQSSAASIAVASSYSLTGTFESGASPQEVDFGTDVSGSVTSGDIVLSSSSTYITGGAFYARALPTSSTVNFTLTPGGGGSAYTFADAAASTAVTLTFGRIDYTLPTAIRSMYSARLMTANRALTQINQRDYDRLCPVLTVDTPRWYTLYVAEGSAPKIRLLPVPASADFLVLRYVREVTIPSGASDVLDIPRDAEFAVLALARGYYLTDKGEEKAAFWLQQGEAALREARAREMQDSDMEDRFQREGSIMPVGWPETF